jgi:phospholipase/carboxylesterase
MENTKQLSGPERLCATGGKPDSLVILLHGYGSDGNDLIGLAPLLAQHLPNTHFISPNAPFACEMSPGGHQWFSLRDWSPSNMLKGAEEAAPLVHHFANAQLERLGLTEDRLAWVGFSQGTMMSLHVALKRKRACAAVVGFSGALVVREIIAKPPVCLIHGDSDTVVPFAAMSMAEQTLKQAGVPVTTLGRPNLGHGIDPEGLDTAASFIKQRFM